MPSKLGCLYNKILGKCANSSLLNSGTKPHLGSYNLTMCVGKEDLPRINHEM